jgi:hypothetical protein
MPQEYIDAALEVKLRYDACAPRAGFVCVQDRRVRGGFYYRKAPQGQGVNALPPSKLEKALARSQEESRPRSEMGFLGKAAIGAGLAVGGLALTGAVINAGRSSEPYQEPVRQRPTSPESNNVTNVGLGVGAAATVGLGVGAAIANKPVQPVNTDIKEVQPIVEEKESQPPVKSPKSQQPEIKTPEQEEGYKIEKELIDSKYISQNRGYESALSASLKEKQYSPEDIQRKVSSLDFEGDEGFVRIEDVKSRIGGGRITKAGRDRQSLDMQALYDKFKDYGLEDAIEFRGATNKKDGSPLGSPSANKYLIDLRDGNPPIAVGEMRFRKTRAEVEATIAEKLKNPEAKSQPPQKSAKPQAPKSDVETPQPEKNTRQQKRTLVDDLSAKLSRNISEDGFVAQSGLVSELRKKPQYKNTDIDQEIEDLAKNSGGRIQLVTDKYGKTLVRDLDQVKTSKLISEAQKLTDPESDRKKLLDDAVAYKEARATSEEERTGVAELKAAITGIKPKEDTPKKGRSKPPKEEEQVTSEAPPEVTSDKPPTRPKSKKELAQEESARISKVFDEISSIKASYELQNTKKFSQADQDVFAEKATPEQKTKLSNLISKEIEVLGLETPEGKGLANLHEAMVGKKYVKPASQQSTPAANTGEQNATRSQPTTIANTPNPEREKAAKLTVAKLKELLDARNITIPKGAKKDQLLHLLVPENKPNNDASAPAEAYLEAYWETRDQLRRVG